MTHPTSITLPQMTLIKSPFGAGGAMLGFKLGSVAEVAALVVHARLMGEGDTGLVGAKFFFEDQIA